MDLLKRLSTPLQRNQAKKFEDELKAEAEAEKAKSARELPPLKNLSYFETMSKPLPRLATKKFEKILEEEEQENIKKGRPTFDPTVEKQKKKRVLNFAVLKAGPTKKEEEKKDDEGKKEGDGEGENKENKDDNAEKPKQEEKRPVTATSPPAAATGQQHAHGHEIIRDVPAFNFNHSVYLYCCMYVCMYACMYACVLCVSHVLILFFVIQIFPRLNQRKRRRSKSRVHPSPLIVRNKQGAEGHWGGLVWQRGGWDVDWTYRLYSY